MLCSICSAEVGHWTENIDVKTPLRFQWATLNNSLCFLPEHMSCPDSYACSQCKHRIDPRSAPSSQGTHSLGTANTATMSSNPQDLKPRTFNPAGVPEPPPTYNHAAVTPLLATSRLITLAGLTGCDPASRNNPKTLPEQAKIAYSKIETCLAAAGATPRDIVQVRASRTSNGPLGFSSCKADLMAMCSM